MSDSVRPHRQKPTRLPHPWDSPGKNTGVGCHFLLQCMKVKSESEVAQSCLTLRNPMDCSLPDSCTHGIFQARVLEWGCQCLLVDQLYLMAWRAKRQASLSITSSWSLLKLMSIELVMPSNHLILCRPLLPPSIFASRVISNESVRIRCPKYWDFQLQHQSFQ